MTVPTHADDNTDPSVQFSEATSASVRTCRMNISSPEDAVESKPFKKEEETDPLEMPVQDARISSNQVQQTVIKEEFNDGLSMMDNTGLFPAASPKANLISEKMKKNVLTSSYEPVKVEQCATDKDSLVIMTAALAHENVKKEDFNDNLSTVVDFDREPLISYKRSFVHEKDKNKKSDLHGSHSRVANESFVVPSEVTNLTSTDKATPMASNSRCEIEMDCTNLLEELDDSQEDGISGKMLDAANETSGSESDCSVRSVENFDPSDKRRRRLSIWESNAESESAVANKSSRDDDHAVESGKMNENSSASDRKDLSSKGELKCLECLAVFKTNDEFQQHIRSHKGYKRFQCDTCQKRFTCSSNLKKHKFIHTGARPFKCRICEKSFNRSGHLRLHELIHTGELPYECVTCEKGFKTNLELIIHERIHTGDRPYKCSTCGKRFTQNGNLRSHTRLHTGDKPYVCSTCGKSFNESTHLKTHIRTHTGEKPYKCTSCEKRFATSSNLRSHEKSHKVINSGEPPDVQQQPMDQSCSIELTAVPDGAVTEQKIHYNSQDVNSMCLFSFGELNLPPKIVGKPNIESLGELETELKKFAGSQGM